MVELAGIVVLGIFAQWLAWRIQQPAILPLIIIGLLVGPIACFDFLFGHKLIDPDELFASDFLNHFVSLSVGLILFEGGLTLKYKEVKQVASTVRNLVTFGALITLVGGGMAAHFILEMDWRVSLLFGALIIVTGPTVIGPILRNAHPNSKVSTILKWEGIIIDPIGAFVAVLMYEFIISGTDVQFTLTAVFTFLKTILAGTAIGIACAVILYQSIKANFVPHYLLNVVSLGLVFIAFTISDLISAESGLLSVTVMGVVLANMRLSELSAILNFKETLTVLLISILFILLSAKIDLAQLELLGANTFIVFAVVVFGLRPLSVVVSSIGSNLNWREKMFISWVGPRGIVAAAIASIFAIKLIKAGVLDDQAAKDAELLIPLTFLIILGTVILQGMSSKGVARLLGVTKRNSNGFLILGAHEAARVIAKYLKNSHVPVYLVDTSHTNANEARSMGLIVFEKNILSDETADEIELIDVGQFIALTSNNELNIFACRKFQKDSGEEQAFRLITKNEQKFTSLSRPVNIMFADKADYYGLVDLAKKHPLVHEIPIRGENTIKSLVGKMSQNQVPLFIKNKEGKFRVFMADVNKNNADEGDKLVYLGEPMTIK